VERLSPRVARGEHAHAGGRRVAGDGRPIQPPLAERGSLALRELLRATSQLA
jgi:hypothetical protein